MPKDAADMSFQSQCAAQSALVATTWQDVQDAHVAANPTQWSTAVAAHCAALNGLSWLGSQHFGGDMETYSGGTEKPRNVAS